MAAQPFHVGAAEPSGLRQRLFWRRSGTRALAELADRLAHADRPTDVTELDVARIAEAHGCDPIDRFPHELIRLYRSYLEFCLVDRHLEEEEVRCLDHLRRLFRLPEREVRAVHDSTSRSIYGESVDHVLADGQLTDDERRFLRRLEEQLGLPADVAHRIYDDAAHGRLRAALSEALADERLSDDEHDELRAMSRSLGVDLAMDGRTRRVYDRMRLYWLIENGEPSPLPCDIPLRRGERCIATRRATWIAHPGEPEQRRSGPIGRARTATAIFLRPLAVPARRLQEPGDDGHARAAGRLFLTDRRLIFVDRRRRRTCSLSAIADFRPFANGVQLELHRHAHPFIQLEDNVDLFCLKLDRALREAAGP